MKCCKFIVLASGCVVMALAATALDYPVYTVTTSGDGTTSLASAQVEVISTEGATPETVAFSSLTLTSGTFRKRGTGYLLSDDAMKYTFTLRDNVLFHNGDAVKAEDVVYSLKRCAGFHNDGRCTC